MVLDSFDFQAPCLYLLSSVVDVILEKREKHFKFWIERRSLWFDMNKVFCWIFFGERSGIATIKYMLKVLRIWYTV